MSEQTPRGILGKAFAEVPDRFNPSPAQRRAIYRTASAVLLVLVLHKVVTADEAGTYLTALTLALGIVPAELAARNVTP